MLADSISVIVPVYNGAGNLLRTLQSLKPSMEAGIEVIAVNDASTDHTGQVLKEFGQQHASLPFRIITHALNLGVHAARLSGIAEAKGSWIGFLDADDLAAPHQYQRMAEQGQVQQADLVICGSDWVSPDHRLIEHKVRFHHTEIVSTNIFPAFCQWRFGTGALWNKLYRADLIRTAFTRPFLWRHDGIEDTLVNIGAFLQASKVVLLAETLHFYVRQASSLTQSASNAYGFVRIFRAYAMALHAFQAEGPAVWQQITELYQRQLCFACYAIAPGDALHAHQALLEEAVAVINRIYPLGLALLAACPPPDPPTATGPRRALVEFKRALRPLVRLASARHS
jgi:glycosyltransferase involved in cell wall biosynthesis